MAKLTLTIDDETLRQASRRALEEGTSVQAVVREYLEAFAGPERQRRALSDFVRLAESAEAASGASGRSWTRDELYDR